MHANTYISRSWQDGNKGWWSLRDLLLAQHSQGGLVLQDTPVKIVRMVHRTNCPKSNSGLHVFYSRSHEIRSPPPCGCAFHSGYSKPNPACRLWEAEHRAGRGAGRGEEVSSLLSAGTGWLGACPLLSQTGALPAAGYGGRARTAYIPLGANFDLFFKCWRFLLCPSISYLIDYLLT